MIDPYNALFVISILLMTEATFVETEVTFVDKSNSTTKGTFV